MQNPHPKRAFTLIELVVVVSILAILAGVLVPRVSNHMRAANDAQRLADIKMIRNAIEQYYMDKGTYPKANTNSAYGGWDVSHDGNFIDELVETGYLERTPRDPINDATYHYRYYIYNRNSYGCSGQKKFYVLGIRNFESAGFARKNQGFFRCSGRNWGTEFAYVTGGGTTLED